MSHQKWNVLFVLLLLLFATATASAQVESARFFAPYQYDQFGGGGRMPEGFFGNLNLKYATIARSPRALVGHEEKRRYLDNNRNVQYQMSNLDTDQLATSFAIGAEAEMGYVRGHHGWVFGGYGMRGITGSASGRNASINILDSLTYNATTVINTTPPPLWMEWDNVLNDANEVQQIPGVHGTPIAGNGIAGVGYLWGWFPYYPNRPGVSDGILAPLPVTFDRYSMENTVDHWSMEAMYMYRCHPTRMGTLELFGGVRYLSIDDTFRFSGTGSPWRDVTQVPYPQDAYPSWVPSIWIYEDTYLAGIATGAGSVLANASWSQQAQNHIIAPQVALRYTKRWGRWSLVADAKGIFGFNSQNKTITGYVSSYMDQYTSNYTSYDPLGFVFFDAPTTTGVPLPWTPIGVNGTNSRFSHRKFSSEFSPGVEGKLSTNFQATNAVGFTFGVEGLWMDKIARGAMLNNYEIDDKGTFFGFREGSHMDYFLMYGFRFGVTINR